MLIYPGFIGRIAVDIDNFDKQEGKDYITDKLGPLDGKLRSKSFFLRGSFHLIYKATEELAQLKRQEWGIPRRP